MKEQQEFDRVAGQVLKECRRRVGMSQEDLARALTALGFPCHQQTVLKIERGSRPLKLAEAHAIAEVFRAQCAAGEGTNDRNV